MAIFNNFYIRLLYTLILISTIICETPEGGKCYHRRSESPGTCKIIDNCKEAEDELIQKDILPQICGYKEEVMVVCCRNKKISQSKRGNTEMKIDVANGISRGLCLHYESKVYSVQNNIYDYGTGPTNTSLCGTLDRPLIYGGTLAEGKEFPHMALIGYGEEDEKVWQCGGSLITEEWILTAAHCQYSWINGEARFVRLGDLDYADNRDDAEPQDFEIIQKETPPKNIYPGSPDIALFKLNKKAKITAYVRPACLWIGEEVKSKKKTKIDKVIVSGWGVTEYGGEPSSHLLKATIKLVSCSKGRKMNTRDSVTDSMHVCAGAPFNESIKDTCLGDSGGPLQIYAEDLTCMYYIVGVTSGGMPCGLTRVPGVYMRVSNYISWIESIIWKPL